MAFCPAHPGSVWGFDQNTTLLVSRDSPLRIQEAERILVSCGTFREEVPSGASGRVTFAPYLIYPKVRQTCYEKARFWHREVFDYSTHMCAGTYQC